jgi:hypothetical protein
MSGHSRAPLNEPVTRIPFQASKESGDRLLSDLS